MFCFSIARRSWVEHHPFWFLVRMPIFKVFTLVLCFVVQLRNRERFFLKFLAFVCLVFGVFVFVVEQKVVCYDMFLGIFICGKELIMNCMSKIGHIV